MRITNLKLEHGKNLTRVSASVNWEDCDQPAREIYIETDKKFAEDISCNPHAFLVGCIIPAMHFGEKRILLEAEICPGLREGLKTVMALIKDWSGGTYRPLDIETQDKFCRAPLKRAEASRNVLVRGNRLPCYVAGQQNELPRTTSRVHKRLPAYPWL